MKESKHQRQEWFDIKAIISKAKLQVFNAQIIGIVNQREDIKVDQEIRLSYDCIIQIS